MGFFQSFVKSFKIYLDTAGLVTCRELQIYMSHPPILNPKFIYSFKNTIFKTNNIRHFIVDIDLLFSIRMVVSTCYISVHISIYICTYPAFSKLSVSGGVLKSRHVSKIQRCQICEQLYRLLVNTFICNCERGYYQDYNGKKKMFLQIFV